MYGEYASGGGVAKYIFTCVYYTLLNAGFKDSDQITKSYMEFRLFNSMNNQLNLNLLYFIDSFIIPEINKLLIFYEDTFDFENRLGVH